MGLWFALKGLTRRLDALWDDQGLLSANRGRALGPKELAELLRAGPIRFVVADVGHDLAWYSETECYDLWKYDVKPHLVAADAHRWHPEDYPGGYAYVATEWIHGSGPVVLLEKAH